MEGLKTSKHIVYILEQHRQVRQQQQAQGKCKGIFLRVLCFLNSDNNFFFLCNFMVYNMLVASWVDRPIKCISNDRINDSRVS